jgi:hypothetical protein
MPVQAIICGCPQGKALPLLWMISSLPHSMVQAVAGDHPDDSAILVTGEKSAWQPWKGKFLIAMNCEG